MSSDDQPIHRMDLDEFRRGGFLQEANRRFFHPLGLALEVVVAEDGTATLGGIWDCRDDEEGIIFTGGVDREKVDHVAAEYERHRERRLRLMGDVIQPVDWASS